MWMRRERHGRKVEIDGDKKARVGEDAASLAADSNATK